MRKILVAGGAGFLGSHLTDRLLEDEHTEVVVVDNLCTGSLENLSHLKNHPRFYMIQGDITVDNTLERLHWQAWDEIYNLACPASPVHYQRMPISTTLTCVLGTYNLLRLANKSSARFLQASTSEVYGDPVSSPQRETDWGHVNSFGPRACYDEGKRAAEALIYDFRTMGVDTRLVRIFNTYGPRMAVDDGRVVSNFLTQAIRGESLTIYGNGEQTRSFCYVDDLVSGLITVMRSDYKNPVNLGNPEEFPIRDLVTLMNLTIPDLRGRIKVEFKELPQDDPRQRRPDITVAKSLGWQPTVKLQQGLQFTYEYFNRKLRS